MIKHPNHSKPTIYLYKDNLKVSQIVNTVEDFIKYLVY